jgi:hypothetical protein
MEFERNEFVDGVTQVFQAEASGTFLEQQQTFHEERHLFTALRCRFCSL